jgi:hypothetical protein
MKATLTKREPWWVNDDGWTGPVLELKAADWRIKALRGSYYTHTVRAQATAAEIVRALGEQYGIRSCNCARDPNDRNPLSVVIIFRNVKPDGIGGPDYTLRRVKAGG